MNFETKVTSFNSLAKFMIEWEDNVKRYIIETGNGEINYELLWKELIKRLEGGSNQTRS